MNDLSALTDTELVVMADSCRSTLLKAWQRGQAGSTTTLYDLARATAEAQVRGNPGVGHVLVGQLSLFKDEPGTSV